MSCFRQQKTEMTDQVMLVEALKQMGLEAKVGSKEKVRGDRAETSAAACEVIIKKETSGKKADIGFSKGTDGNFTMVMDTYVGRDVNFNTFLSEVKRNYVERKSIRTARNAGLAYLGRKIVTQNGKKVTQLQFQQA